MKRLAWTPELVGRFWNGIAGTKLADLSFSRAAGPYLVTAIEPHLRTGGRHLDYGAGDGDLVSLLADAGYPAAAYEPAAERRAALLAKLGGRPGFLGAVAPEAAGSFDVVLLVEVIEHVLDESLDRVLSEINALTTPGGTLVVTTPNDEDLEASMVYCPVSDVLFNRWQHVRSFTAASLTALLRRYGFEPVVVHELELTAQAFDGWVEGMDRLRRSAWVGRATRLMAARRRRAEFASGRSVRLGAASTLVYVGRKVRGVP